MQVDAILELGKRGLMQVVTLPEQQKPIWNRLVETVQAEQLQERTYTETGFGLLQQRSNDAPVQSDTLAVINYSSYKTKLYGLKASLPEYVWQRPAFDAYGKFRNIGTRLVRAVSHTKDYLATRMYIDGFSSFTTPDGIAVFGTHTRYNGGSVSNYTHNSLSVTSLLEAIGVVASNVNHRGIPMGLSASGFKLIVGPTQYPDAAIIVKSSGLSDRMDRADNVVFGEMIKEIVINDWFNSNVISGSGNLWYLIPNEASQNPLNFIVFQNDAHDMQYFNETLQVAAVSRFGLCEAAFHDAQIYGGNAA